jgi:glycosyltransferase involved in cell wall biosynthesis/tetratricopeptide (TPR) repeat protein
MFRLRRSAGRSSPIILGDRARDAQQWDVAAHHYRAALLRNPDNPPIWVQFGHALKEGGSHQAAEAAYRRAIAYDPAAPDPYLQLGHVLKLRGRTGEAKTAYLHAHSLDPTLREAMVELAALGCSAQDLPQLVREVPTPAAAKKSGGDTSWRRKRRKESLITRADRARDLGQWDLAVGLYRQALDRNPANPPIWIQYGHARKEAGQRDAEMAYRRALAYDPRLTDGHLHLGRVLKLRGKTEAARLSFLQAFALDPSLSAPLGELAGLGWDKVQVDELKALIEDDESHLADASHRHRREIDDWRRPDSVSHFPATPSDAQHGLSTGTQGVNGAKTLKSIAYITNRPDTATMMYRVYNYADAFSRAGVVCTIVDFTDVKLSDVENTDIVIFCRIPETPKLCEIVLRCRSNGQQVIYDVDDLIFDPDRIEYLRAAANPQNRDLYLSLMTNTAAMMRHFDLVTVATFALKQEVERFGKTAHVVPNTLALTEARPGEGPPIPRRGERLRISYLSGTGTHDDDFAVCKAALTRLMRECDDVELMIVGTLDASEFEQFGKRLIRLPYVPHSTMLGYLKTADINLAPLEPGNPFTNCKSELKVFEAASFGIPTIASPVSGYGSVIVHGVNGLLAISTEDWYERLLMLREKPDRRAAIGEAAKRSIAPRFLVADTVDEAMAVYSLALSGRYRRPLASVVPDDDLPSISVVAPLYNKQAEVSFFLESLRRQSYRGQYEVVLVNDCTPDASVTVVENFERYQMTACDTNPNMRLRIISLASNGGNCVSRNTGIRESDGDIIVIVDADCMFNRDFLALHAQAYAHGDCDVAIGPINIETSESPPLAVLNSFELDPSLADRRSDPQDPMVRDSFVNCITRNFSVRRSFLAGIPGTQLFDEEFGYSADPRSGFGWEDVEMGYRLYMARARIKYLATTVSIHVSHYSNNQGKSLRSLRNFRRLHDRHPDLLLTARSWSVRTYDAIVNWVRADGESPEENDDYKALEPRFPCYARPPVVLDRSAPLRILTYRWHCSHQYELYRLGHSVTLVRGGGAEICDAWDWAKRPLPTNARFRDVSEISPRDFDVAILHFDENVLHPERGNGVLTDDWGASFRRGLTEWDIPKIAICHGTPQFRGQYDASYSEPDLGTIIEESRQELVDALADVPVVCNSAQAEREWGFRKSLTIWHGFSPHEYPVGRHDRGILSMNRGAFHRPHYNGMFVHDSVRDLLGDEAPISHLNVPDPNSGYEPDTWDWAVAKFQNYVAALGEYSVYFNPTIRSPMPRTRGEAMMSGLVSVSLRNYDVDQFIENGVNGFYADTAEELAEHLKYLVRNPWSRQRMALASRRTALDLFNLDRYLASWSKLLAQIVG